MNSTLSLPPRKGVFYGWIALAGVGLVLLVVGGSFVHAFGVLLPEITREFTWNRGQVALALTMGILAFGLPSPFFGTMVNRFGPRKTIIIGNALAAVGLAGVYFVNEVWHLYLLYILVGLGAGFGGFIASTALVNNWFIKKRSVALGIFQACAGLGGFIFPPLVTTLISTMGWRSTWLVLASIIICVPVIIGGVFLIRNKPEDMGLRPDGIPPDSESEIETIESDTAVSQDRHSGWGVLNIIRKPTVLFIAGFAAANAFTVGILMTHQIAYIQDIGYDPLTAATTLSVMSGFALMGSLGFGFLALKLDIRILASAAFVCQIVAMTILLTTRELGLLYIFAVIMGISNGSMTAALPVFIGAYFPRERYAQVIGVTFPFHVTANASSAFLAGVIFDATSSYTPAFIAAVCISVAGLFFAFMARRPKTI
ncbi:MAG: MFS transporter [Dehalococcoidia bacterium]|jgi:MFS family permease